MALAVLSMEVGCGGTSATPLSSDQTLRVNGEKEPATMDPSRQAFDYEALVSRNIFEPLLKPTADLKDVRGAAASSYDVQADGLTYIFHLRGNAKWSDGKPVAASDFLFGWKRLLDPRLAAPYAHPFFDGTVAGAQSYLSIDPANTAAVTAFLDGLGLLAPDDHTFVVKLQKPAGWFKWIAALWVAAPVRQDKVQQFGSDNWATSPAQIIGNGPFRVTGMAPDHYSLVPNVYYWAGTPTLKHLEIYFVGDPQQAFRLYRSGDLDVTDVPLANSFLVQDDPTLGKEIRRFPTLTTIWLTMNTRIPPFDNAKVREAVSQAIDRQKLITQIGHEQFVAVQTIIPKGMNGYRPDLGGPQKFDVAKAKQALQASGVSQALLNNMNLIIRDDAPTDKRIRDQFIVDQINANLGLHWTLDPVPLATLENRLQSDDFQIFDGGFGADYPDDQDWMDPFLSGCAGGDGAIPACPDDPQFDQLVGRADQTTNETNRQALYDRAQDIIIQNYWVTVLYSPQSWALVKPYVRGIKATPMDERYLPGDFFTADIYITQH